MPKTLDDIMESLRRNYSTCPCCGSWLLLPAQVRRAEKFLKQILTD